MDRETFWANVFVKAAIEIPGPQDIADAALEEFDKRFTNPVMEEFSLDNLPSWDDLLDGSLVESTIVEATFSPSQGMFVLKFAKDGLVATIYTNESTEKDVRWEYGQRGLEWLQDGILEVDSQIDHEV